MFMDLEWPNLPSHLKAGVVFFHLRERLSAPFELLCDVVLRNTTNQEIDQASLLQSNGSPSKITLRIRHDKKETLRIGHLASLHYKGPVRGHPELTLFEMTVKGRPALLRSNFNSRLFQNLSRPAIAATLIEDIGYVQGKDYRFQTPDDIERFQKQPFVVAHQQDDLSLFDDLLGVEAVFYYQDMTTPEQTLVLASKNSPLPTLDAPLLNQPLSGMEPPYSSMVQLKESAGFTSASLEFDTEDDGFGFDESPFFDDTPDDNRDDRVLRDFDKLRHRAIADGTGNYEGSSERTDLFPGSLVTINNAPGSLKGALLIVAVEHTGQQSAVDALQTDSQQEKAFATYRNRFAGISERTPYIPPHSIRLQTSRGLVAATLDGASGKVSDYDTSAQYIIRYPFDQRDNDPGTSSPRTPLAMPFSAPQKPGEPGAGWHLPLAKNATVVAGTLGGDLTKPVILGALPHQDFPTPVPSLSDQVVHELGTPDGNRMKMVDSVGAAGWTSQALTTYATDAVQPQVAPAAAAGGGNSGNAAVVKSAAPEETEARIEFSIHTHGHNLQLGKLEMPDEATTSMEGEGFRVEGTGEKKSGSDIIGSAYREMFVGKWDPNESAETEFDAEKTGFRAAAKVVKQSSDSTPVDQTVASEIFGGVIKEEEDGETVEELQGTQLITSVKLSNSNKMTAFLKQGRFEDKDVLGILMGTYATDATITQDTDNHGLKIALPSGKPENTLLLGEEGDEEGAILTAKGAGLVHGAKGVVIGSGGSPESLISLGKTMGTVMSVVGGIALAVNIVTDLVFLIADLVMIRNWATFFGGLLQPATRLVGYLAGSKTFTNPLSGVNLYNWLGQAGFSCVDISLNSLTNVNLNAVMGIEMSAIYRAGLTSGLLHTSLTSITGPATAESWSGDINLTALLGNINVVSVRKAEFKAQSTENGHTAYESIFEAKQGHGIFFEVQAREEEDEEDEAPGDAGSKFGLTSTGGGTLVSQAANRMHFNYDNGPDVATVTFIQSQAFKRFAQGTGSSIRTAFAGLFTEVG